MTFGKVFLSYSRKDDAIMKRIVHSLRKQGINVWVDNEKLVPGTPIWESEIEKAIKSATAVVVILSPDSKKSEWVRREITLADQYRTRIFPVLARGDPDSSITIRLITRQYVDIRQNEELGLNSLSTAIFAYLQRLEAQEQRAREEVENLARQTTADIRVRRDATERAEAEPRIKGKDLFGAGQEEISQNVEPVSRPKKPVSFPEEIKSTKPTSLPEKIISRRKPKDLPR